MNDEPSLFGPFLISMAFALVVGLALGVKCQVINDDCSQVKIPSGYAVNKSDKRVSEGTTPDEAWLNARHECTLPEGITK